jgi:drug/metabolite transporter (DMT)-like permease
MYVGELAAVATAACWTVTAMAFEVAGRRVGSLPVNMIRLLMAIVLLAGYNAAARGQALPLDAAPHAWLWLSVSGLVGFTVGDLCLFRAFVVIGSRLSMLLMALVPPLTALMGRLLMGERLAGLDWLGMALTVGGVGWVVLERGRDGQGRAGRLPVSGVLLGLGGAGGQAGGLVLSKYGMRTYDAFAATQIRVLAGAAGFILLFSLLRLWPRVVASLRDRAAMGHITLGAVFGPFLGVSFSLLAVKHTQAGVAATIMSLVPVLIIPPSILILRERVSPRAWAGAVVAVGGSALLFLG